MANQEHLDLLHQGVERWNQWRKTHTQVRPDLSGADLRRADFRRADFHETDLSEADLRGADLSEANLYRASLFGANLGQAYFSYSRDTDLYEPNIRGTDLRMANLNETDLRRAVLVGTDLTGAILTNCEVYGISAWDVQLQGARQENLVITLTDQPTITVDNLKVAQFIYVLLNNQEIRDLIASITTKVVLILGRFNSERKAILETIRDELRKQNYIPVLFDFEKPLRQTMAETISTLAHLARFIIVDLTDPRSVPAELATIVPHCLVPVQPLLEMPAVVVEENVTGTHVVEESTVRGKEYALFRSLQLYPWVLPVVHYQDTIELLTSLKERVIDPAEQKAQELARQK